ncbi:Undefined function [Listeria monocytogenes N53-1]|nr:Undefined function [Listeria monocytogenes N53-1]
MDLEVEKIFKGYEQKLTKIDNNEVAFIGENYALGIGWREGIDLHYFKLDNSKYNNLRENN